MKVNWWKVTDHHLPEAISSDQVAVVRLSIKVCGDSLLSRSWLKQGATQWLLDLLDFL